MQSSRCRWIKDLSLDGGGFWVPACHARALCADACDCPKPPKRAREEEDWFEMIERRISALEKARGEHAPKESEG